MAPVSTGNVRELEKHHWEGQRVQVLRLLRGSDRLLRNSNWLTGQLVDQGDRESGVRLRYEEVLCVLCQVKEKESDR